MKILQSLKNYISDLSHLSISGKNKIVDASLELDWNNAFDVPAASTLYQANKAGIIIVRGTKGIAAAYCSPTSFDVTNEHYYGILTGMNSQSTGVIFIQINVPKNHYYITNEDMETLIYRKFILFKN